MHRHRCPRRRPALAPPPSAAPATPVSAQGGIPRCGEYAIPRGRRGWAISRGRQGAVSCGGVRRRMAARGGRRCHARQYRCPRHLRLCRSEYQTVTGRLIERKSLRLVSILTTHLTQADGTRNRAPRIRTRVERGRPGERKRKRGYEREPEREHESNREHDQTRYCPSDVERRGLEMVQLHKTSWFSRGGMPHGKHSR